jgi:hypothetical protein
MDTISILFDFTYPLRTVRPELVEGQSPSASLRTGFDRLRANGFGAKEALNKSPSASLRTGFDKLRTNGKYLIPFVVSLSNHTANPLVQRFPK